MSIRPSRDMRQTQFHEKLRNVPVVFLFVDAESRRVIAISFLFSLYLVVVEGPLVRATVLDERAKLSRREILCFNIIRCQVATAALGARKQRESYDGELKGRRFSRLFLPSS